MTSSPTITDDRPDDDARIAAVIRRRAAAAAPPSLPADIVLARAHHRAIEHRRRSRAIVAVGSVALVLVVAAAVLTRPGTADDLTVAGPGIVASEVVVGGYPLLTDLPPDLEPGTASRWTAEVGPQPSPPDDPQPLPFVASPTVTMRHGADLLEFPVDGTAFPASATRYVWNVGGDPALRMGSVDIGVLEGAAFRPEDAQRISNVPELAGRVATEADGTFTLEQVGPFSWVFEEPTCLPNGGRPEGGETCLSSAVGGSADHVVTLTVMTPGDAEAFDARAVAGRISWVDADTWLGEVSGWTRFDDGNPFRGDSLLTTNLAELPPAPGVDAAWDVDVPDGFCAAWQEYRRILHDNVSPNAYGSAGWQRWTERLITIAPPAVAEALDAELARVRADGVHDPMDRPTVLGRLATLQAGQEACR